MRILLLEPDRVLAKHLEGFFSQAGHSLSYCVDPQSAVNSIDKQIPDVIITELELAGRSGVEFLYELRSYPEWLEVPVIIYTGLSAEQVSDYKLVFDELNIDKILPKSITSLAQLLSEAEVSQHILNEKV
jgi:DNA-binding response OmpR family regulator